MGLWGILIDVLTARPSLPAAIAGERASTQFALEHAHSVEQLESVVALRGDEIEADNACLAQLRLAASKRLCAEVLRAVSHVSAEARRRRDEARALLRRTRPGGVWTRFAESGGAEREFATADVLDTAAAALLAFVGLHGTAADAVRAALARGSGDGLARAIVAACRQVAAFLRAVKQGRSTEGLATQVGSMVGNAVAAGGRDPAGTQLGQFWNQNGGTDRVGITPKDVRLTLQILRQELTDVRGIAKAIMDAVALGGTAWNVQRPSLFYTELLVAGSAVTRVLWTRSRFAGGSGELEDAIARGLINVRNFAKNNVITPACGLYSQIFRDTVTAASMESVAQAQLALTKMLVEYTEDNLKHVPQAREAAERGDMGWVMQFYAEQVRRPFNNLVFGNLSRTILLQVQKLKCDVEELVVKSKQQLQAQELNLALVALIPAIFVVATATIATTQALRAWRSRGTELVVSPEQTVRFLLGNVYDCFVALKEEQTGGIGDPEDTVQHMQRVGELALAFFETKSLVEKGVLRGPPQVLDRFLEDVSTLETSDLSLDSKIQHLQKMWSCYPFFMPLEAARYTS